MAHTRIVLVCAALALTQFVPAAQAQRQGQATQETTRAQSEPTFQLRARSGAERLATARRVLGPQFTIAPAYLNNPFVLKPNQPSVEGRGWLEATNISRFDARWGIISANSADGRILVALEDAIGKRFLVECWVRGVRVRARTESTTVEIEAPSNGALLSIVTARGEDRVALSSASGPLLVVGCEITRLQ